MRIVKKMLIFCLVAVCLLTLFGCGTKMEHTDKLHIVTTNFPPYDFARSIAGEKAEVTMLLAPGQEGHAFEPTPKDIVSLTKADLIIWGGGTSDQWMKTLLDSAEIDSRKTISMMEVALGESAIAHRHTPEAHSDHYAYDEHVWTSPVFARNICNEILSYLCNADEENAVYFKENATRYINALTALDKAFEETTQHMKKPLIFGDRFPFRHFTLRYQLSYFAAFPGCGDNTEPDAATVRNLIDIVKKEKIAYVYYTEFSNHKVADAICEATGAKSAMLHSCHTVTKEEFENGETYLSLMNKNLETLKEALLS